MKFSRTEHYRTIEGQIQIFVVDNYTQPIMVLNHFPFLGPKIRELVPRDTKQSESLKSFKNKIKKWVPSKCPCRICRIYLQNIGFL